MLTYIQSTGHLIDDKGNLWGVGYAGRDEGRNNPAAQHIRNIGPVPAGDYMMGAAFDDPGGKGPCVMVLHPKEQRQLLGRSGFMIHGDNKEHNASHGCIILGPAVRRKIAKLEDRSLRVIAAVQTT